MVSRTEKIAFLTIWAIAVVSLFASVRTDAPLSTLLFITAMVLTAIYGAYCMVLFRRVKRQHRKRNPNHPDPKH